MIFCVTMGVNECAEASMIFFLMAVPEYDFVLQIGVSECAGVSMIFFLNGKEPEYGFLLLCKWQCQSMILCVCMAEPEYEFVYGY